MHEFVNEAERNHTHTLDRVVAPALFECWNPNGCVSPLPASGVTASAVTAGAAPGTVQAPSVCQPPVVLPLRFVAYKPTAFGPPNVDAKVTSRVSVSVVPLSAAPVAPLNEMEH